MLFRNLHRPENNTIPFEHRCCELVDEKLIKACIRDGEAEMWEEFIRRFQPLIAGVVARTATLWTTLTAELVDELVQNTCLTLCTRRLREFQSYCYSEIRDFLKSVAYDVTMDYFKEQPTFKRSIKTLRASDLDGPLQTEATKGLPPNDALVHEIEEFINRIISGERDKLVFLLYYRQRFSARLIAQIPGIRLSINGVESCVSRLTSLLRDQIERSSVHSLIQKSSRSRVCKLIVSRFVEKRPNRISPGKT